MASGHDTLSQSETDKSKLLCDCRDCCNFISLMTDALNDKHWANLLDQAQLASNYTSKCDTAVRQFSYPFRQIALQVSRHSNITDVPIEIQTTWKDMVTDLHHKIHNWWEIAREEQVNNKGKVNNSNKEEVAGTTAVERRCMKLWPHSDKWDLKLTGLARMESTQCERVGSMRMCTNEEYCISTEGQDGTSTYLGIRHKRAVAVKRCNRNNTDLVRKMKLERDLLFETEGEHIIRCYDYILSEAHVFLLIELPRHTLDGYVKDLKEKTTLRFEATSIIHQIIKGLQSLHNQGILHRNLTPETVVIDANLRVRLAGIGSGHKLKEGEEFVFSKEGTSGWRAKETLSRDNPSGWKESDIQVAGMLIHFVLTGGQHPFGDLLKQPLSTIEENIRSGKYKLRVDKQDPVARDLLHWMLEDDLHQRPNCDQVLNHPFMWNDDHRLDFLECARNVCRSANSHHAWEEVNKRCSQKYCVALQDWRKKVNPPLLEHMEKDRVKKYGRSVGNLLNFIRNFRQHFLDFPEELQKEVNDKDFLRDYMYPCLLLHTYKSLEKTDWTKKMPLQKYY